MKKLITGLGLTLLILLLAIYWNNSQVESKSDLPVYSQIIEKSLKKKYPAYIIYKVQEIANVTPISIDSQQRLSHYFYKQDSLANEALKQGISSNNLSKFYTHNTSILKDFLTPLEYNDYVFIIEGQSNVSQLRNIIKMREELKIKEPAIKKLLKKIDQSENSEKIIEKNIESDFQTINKVLPKEIHIQFYRLQNEEKAKELTQKEIQELIENSFINIKDSLHEYSIIYPFNLEKLTLTAYWEDSGNEKEYGKAINKLEISQPKLLKRLNLYKNFPWWVLGKKIIDNKEKLDLTEEQFDAILISSNKTSDEFDRWEKLKNNEYFDRKLHEYNFLMKILNRDQLNKFMPIYRRKDSEDVAKRYISELEKYNLVNDENRKEIENELFEYELKQQVIGEWIFIENTKENQFKKQVITENKPSILIQLDEERKKEWESKIVKF